MSWTRRAVAAALVGISLLPAACSGDPAARVSLVHRFPHQHSGPLSVAVLTPDGSDTYRTSTVGAGLTVEAAAGNAGSNLREVAWPDGSPSMTDSQACATWTAASSDSSQQGLAFRIVSRPAWTRAITVTKNVEFGVPWIFNVHTWDSADTIGGPWTQVAQLDMQKAVEADGSTRPFPWRVCARVMSNSLELKLWFPATMREPPWGDPTYTRRTSDLPDSYSSPGRTGWYVGHLPPGGSVTYSALGIWSVSTNHS
jgi:hypothetical protein